MPLLIFQFWTATVLTFLKNSSELFKEKTLKMIPKYGRTEAQSWPYGSGKNNTWNCIILKLTFVLYFKMFSVASSRLVLVCNIFEETYFCHLNAYLLACFYGIHLKFYTSHIYFHLDDSELWKQHQSLSQEVMGPDMRHGNSWVTRNSNQVCVMFYNRNLLSRLWRKKNKFSCNRLICPNVWLQAY